MPKGKGLRGATPKQARQYEDIKEKAKKSGLTGSRPICGNDSDQPRRQKAAHGNGFLKEYHHIRRVAVRAA